MTAKLPKISVSIKGAYFQSNTSVTNKGISEKEDRIVHTCVQEHHSYLVFFFLSSLNNNFRNTVSPGSTIFASKTSIGVCLH